MKLIFLRSFLFKLIYYSHIHKLIKTLFQRNRITIIYFHNLDETIAEKCLNYFSKCYTIISLKHFLDIRLKNEINKLPDNCLILTFDDGLMNNFKLTQLFRKYEIVPTIYLCTQIIDTNRGFWWKHNYSGISTEKLKFLKHDERIYQLSKSGFKIDQSIGQRESLSQSEITKMRKWVDFQSHSRFHPILTTCSDNQSWDEISGSFNDLFSIMGKPPYSFSYPNGNYSNREKYFVRKAGYQCAVTTEYGYNDATTDLFQLKRISAGSGSNFYEIVVRTSGLIGLIKTIIKIS